MTLPQLTVLSVLLREPELRSRYEIADRVVNVLQDLRTDEAVALRVIDDLEHLYYIYQDPDRTYHVTNRGRTEFKASVDHFGSVMTELMIARGLVP